MIRRSCPEEEKKGEEEKRIDEQCPGRGNSICKSPRQEKLWFILRICTPVQYDWWEDRESRSGEEGG